MKLLWLIVLVPVVYIAFKFMDSPIFQKSFEGEIVEIKMNEAVVTTSDGGTESIPNSNYSLGQKVQVEILKTRFTAKPIYKTTSTLGIYVNSSGD